MLSLVPAGLAQGEPSRTSASLVEVTSVGLDPDEHQHTQYKALLNSLETYRSYQAEGEWEQLAEGAVLLPGGMDARLPALRERLAREDYLPAVKALISPGTIDILKAERASSTVGAATVLLESGDLRFFYDPQTVAALSRFKDRHGLEPDGILDAKTLEALNETIASKIARIEATMATWRGYGDMGARYVWANIPSYRTEAWENGVRELSMKSMVGLPDRQTPVFSDDMEYAVANPIWYLPKSIMVRDKIPLFIADPTYAETAKFHLISLANNRPVPLTGIDWTQDDLAERYRLEQEPGPENGLGPIKIIFPNDDAIYLHGTMFPELFSKAERALSAGCVRWRMPSAWPAGSRKTKICRTVSTPPWKRDGRSA